MSGRRVACACMHAWIVHSSRPSGMLLYPPRVRLRHAVGFTPGRTGALWMPDHVTRLCTACGDEFSLFKRRQCVPLSRTRAVALRFTDTAAAAVAAALRAATAALVAACSAGLAPAGASSWRVCPACTACVTRATPRGHWGPTQWGRAQRTMTARRDAQVRARWGARRRRLARRAVVGCIIFRTCVSRLPWMRV